MIRALIVDDEAPARAKLRQLLAAEEGVAVAGEAADGEAAVAAIRALHPDVVFLDIQMPRLDGFGVVAAVGVEAMPAVVFVTAHDDHALRAFEVHALDYLLKPYAPSRLRQLLARLRRQLQAPAREATSRIEQMLAALQPAKHLQRLLVEKAPGREAILAVEEIDVLRADGNHVRFHTAAGEFKKRIPLSDLEARLDPERFLRINRSEIVRFAAVKELQPWFHGDYRVILTNGEVLTWSRRYRAKGDGVL